eukprot:COSAG05_NODE_1696_length_4261_cov_2.865596_5_plen_98_part_00
MHPGSKYGWLFGGSASVAIPQPGEHCEKTLDPNEHCFMDQPLGTQPLQNPYKASFAHCMNTEMLIVLALYGKLNRSGLMAGGGLRRRVGRRLRYLTL